AWPSAALSSPTGCAAPQKSPFPNSTRSRANRRRCDEAHRTGAPTDDLRRRERPGPPPPALHRDRATAAPSPRRGRPRATLAGRGGSAAALGAVSSYLVDQSVAQKFESAFPWGTWVINVSGSFILGLITGLSLHHGLSAHVVTVLGAGICGGYTTFSTFNFE